MLRICLIIAIVAGLAAGTVSLWKVREVMVTTKTERDQFETSYKSEQADNQKTHKQLANTKNELATTKNTLASTEADLKSATAEASDLKKQKTDLTAKLAQTKSERDTAQQKLAAWDILNVSPDQVKGIIADLEKTRVERKAFIAENRILNRKVNELNNELLNYRDPDRVVALPLGLKGKILAVDPKYDFVVLDIGKDKNVLERGEMLVNRSGKLIAKVRIVSVNENRCIANVLPGWKQSDVMEGDQVLY